MHNFLAAIFAALFSFCHASSVQQSSQKPVMLAQDDAHVITEHVPTRQEIAHLQTQPVYAEDACISCRKMNVVYYAR